MSAEQQHDMRDDTRHSEQNYINDSAVPGPLWKTDRKEAKREMEGSSQADCGYGDAFGSEREDTCPFSITHTCALTLTNTQKLEKA